MSNNPLRTFINPNAFLLLNVVLMVFFTPMVPPPYHQLVYNILFSCIFILSALSLHHTRKKVWITFALCLIVIIWVAFRIDLPVLFVASRLGQGVFFVFIVIRLISQTANAKHVDVRVIADSINGYLLVGIVYSIVVFSIVRFHPDAFHFPEGDSSHERGLMSKMFYYTFVTYTSTGYGDILPALPGTRSLATLISATGQLYVAIIIALLVGKFSGIETRSSDIIKL